MTLILTSLFFFSFALIHELFPVEKEYNISWQYLPVGVSIPALALYAHLFQIPTNRKSLKLYRKFREPVLIEGRWLILAASLLNVV